MTKRTNLKLTDERQLFFDKAGEIVVRDVSDDPPRNDVIDATFTHLIESYENLEEIRGAYPPQTVKDCCNTSVLGMRYRTSLESQRR